MNTYPTWLKVSGSVLLGVFALALFLVIFTLTAIKTFYSHTNFGSGLTSPDRLSSAIGTSAAPVTLNQTFEGAGSASTTGMRIYGKNNVAIGFSYVPKSYNSQLYFGIDVSLDNGATYVPYTILQDSTTSTLVFTTGATGTKGLPYVVPGVGPTASGTTIGGMFNVGSLTADYIRLFAKESTTSTYGTLYATILLNN